jgi:hypothetical protein
VRAVVDTIVLIFGIFFGGLPGRILSAWAAGRFDLVLSPDVLETDVLEISRVIVATSSPVWTPCSP